MFKIKELKNTAGANLEHTAWKVSKYRVFSGPYFPVFSPTTGKYGQKKLRIWKLLTQWQSTRIML